MFIGNGVVVVQYHRTFELLLHVCGKKRKKETTYYIYIYICDYVYCKYNSRVVGTGELTLSRSKAYRRRLGPFFGLLPRRAGVVSVYTLLTSLRYWIGTWSGVLYNSPSFFFSFFFFFFFSLTAHYTWWNWIRQLLALHPNGCRSPAAAAAAAAQQKSIIIISYTMCV